MHPQLVEDLKEVITNQINEQSIENWLLAQMTKTKKPIFPNEEFLSREEFIARCEESQVCFDEFSRMNAVNKDNEFIVSLNGDLAKLNQAQYLQLKSYFENKHTTFHYQSGELDEFMHSLYEKGSIFFTDGE